MLRRGGLAARLKFLANLPLLSHLPMVVANVTTSSINDFSPRVDKSPTNGIVINPEIFSRSEVISPQNAPLGIRTNTASPLRDEKAKNRFRLQTAAARLLPQERVAKCLHDLAHDQTQVVITYSPESDRVNFRGLMTCGSVWTCPVCSSKITELRRQELTRVIAAVKAKGWGIALATATQRHRKHQNCADLLEAFKQATRRFKSGKRWQRLKARYGFIASIKALEVTYTEANGWHVHAHEMMIFDHILGDDEIQAAAVDFKHLWVKVAAADWSHGFDLKAGFDAVGDYVAKFGREPKNAGWTMEHEIAKSNVKQAAAGGRAPFGLLDDYSQGDLDAGDLFIEYAKAFKGRKQLQGLAEVKKLLGMVEPELTDEELLSDSIEDGLSVVTLDAVTWYGVLDHVSRWEIVCEVQRCQGNPDQVMAWLIDRCLSSPGLFKCLERRVVF